MNSTAEHPRVQGDSSSQSEALASRAASPNQSDKVCLIQTAHLPYLPDQQVELLHLQAEADALILQLQAIQQKRQTQTS